MSHFATSTRRSRRSASCRIADVSTRRQLTSAKCHEETLGGPRPRRDTPIFPVVHCALNVYFLKFNLRNPLAERSPALADEEGIVLWGQSRHQLSTAVGLDYWE